MSMMKQDYILRHIETIGRLLARLRRNGKVLTEEDRAELNEALLLAVHLQEKNFGMPAAEFLGLTHDGQLAVLQTGEAKAAGHARCLTYASLLKDTAELYAFRNSGDLAQGARQLALHVALSVALDQPADAPAVQALIRDLLAAHGGAELQPPTRELLDAYLPLAG